MAGPTGWDRYDSSTYGDAAADIYDEHVDLLGLDTAGAVDRLADLAAGGSVLELGIGTGRLALPLASRGLDVAGVDTSPAMLEYLRTKPGADSLRLAQADLAEYPFDGPFAVVFVAFNTLFILPEQEHQQLCFQQAADVLAPDGRFVIDAFVPDPDRYVNDQLVEVLDVALDHVWLDVSVHVPDAQQVRGQHVRFDHGGGVRLVPFLLHYLWPSEIDEMAAAAGLDLVERHEDWRGSPFVDDSPTHVSVYGLR